jgi:hypothetical protein
MRRKKILSRGRAAASRISDGVGRWLAIRTTRVRFGAVDLLAAPDVRSFNPLPRVQVSNGLAVFIRVSAETEAARAVRRLAAATRIAPVRLLEGGACRDEAMALPRAIVREAAALAKRPGAAIGVKTAGLIPGSAATPRTVAWTLQSEPAVVNGTAHIRQMPQMRSAVPPDCLSLRDYASYTNEAETQKGMTPGSGELLAVFRSVPVEGVAKLRFIEPKKLLFFTMSPGWQTATCRVHDVAAVRDPGGATHIVAHRTRFKTVILG